MPGNQMTVIVAVVACLIGASCMWAVAYGMQHMSGGTGDTLYAEEAPPEMLMTLPPGAVLDGQGGYVMAA